MDTDAPHDSFLIQEKRAYDLPTPYVQLKNNRDVFTCVLLVFNTPPPKIMAINIPDMWKTASSLAEVAHWLYMIRVNWGSHVELDSRTKLLQLRNSFQKTAYFKLVWLKCNKFLTQELDFVDILYIRSMVG